MDFQRYKNTLQEGVPIPGGVCVSNMEYCQTRHISWLFLYTIERIAIDYDIPLEDIRVWFWGYRGSGYASGEYLKGELVKMYGEIKADCITVAKHNFVICTHHLEHEADMGATEYPHLRHILPDPTYIGDDSVRCFAIHEAIHMIDMHVNDDTPFGAWGHGAGFELTYKRLLKKYIEEV